MLDDFYFYHKKDKNLIYHARSIYSGNSYEITWKFYGSKVNHSTTYSTDSVRSSVRTGDWVIVSMKQEKVSI